MKFFFPYLFFLSTSLLIAQNYGSLNGAKFECGYHNNSYSTECSGSLKCYTATLEDTTLTITF